MKFFHFLFLVISLIGGIASFQLFLRTSQSVFGGNYKLAPNAEVALSTADLVHNLDPFMYGDLIHPWNTRIAIEYKYEVGGKTYLGEFFEERSGASDYNKASQLYPKGKKLLLYLPIK